ncbi:MAG: recombinase family protein [Planctomycetia bacterium]
MIAYEGKSAIDIARLFNEHKVGGKKTWSDGRVRQHYGREKLVGKDVLHKTRQVIDRQTGKKKVIQLPASEWIWRDVPHLRILSHELAEAVHRRLSLGAESFGRKAKDRRKKVYRVELYPKVLIRPICGCCSNPMILGRSVGKYQSFFCFNASSGIKGCTNKGSKSARIIDEAVLGVVMATLFTDGFIADLTAEVNKRLAKLDDTHLDAVLAKAEEMGRQLAAKRERLKELQRASRRPNVKRIKTKDVVVALTQLRDLLQGDVGVAAQVLKALVGDVVLEKRQVEGRAEPQMVARFTINAVPALAVLDRGRPGETDGTSWPAACSEQPDELAGKATPKEVVVPL